MTNSEQSLNDLTHTIEIVLFQHFSNCFAGTDFKDDPKKQKYIDAAKEVMRYVSKHDFASEISVVDECFNSRWAWTKKHDAAYQSYEPLARDWFRCGWAEALRQPEPVVRGDNND